MASRTWLAVALSFVVWFAYLKWFMPPPPPQTASPSSEVTSNVQPLGLDKMLVTAPAAKSLEPGELFQLENDFIKLKFDSASGDIYQAQLSQYTEKLGADSSHIEVLSPIKNAGSFQLSFSDPRAVAIFQKGKYRVDRADNKIWFSKRDENASISKEYRLGQNYTVETTIDLELPSKVDGNWGTVSIPLGGRNLEVDHNDPLKAWELIYEQNQKTHRTAWEKIEGETTHQGNSGWLAFGSRYFVGVIINQAELNPDIVTSKAEGFAGGYFRFPLLQKESNHYHLTLKYYFGPKDLKYLDAVPSLNTLVDHGMFAVLAKPILHLLNFFHGYVSNYGVAIILLTILVRALFYPLSLKSARSMRAMQKLQPQLTALREKYKDEKNRFSQEQLALFKAHGVNPAGGCLPILVQLPVFIALYAVLQNSIELFHAPFFGWIRDLSAKDPYYIYPALMGVAMLLQQKMTPTPGMDPMQQKMMLAMPVVFTFMMVNLPSGLTMYIFLSTLLGILQQWMMNREKHRETQSAVISQLS